VSIYFASKESDIQLPTQQDLYSYSENSDFKPKVSHKICPAFESLGLCPQTWKCRFLASHSESAPDGGEDGTGLRLLYDSVKMRQAATTLLKNEKQAEEMPFEELKQFLYTHKGEQNIVYGEKQRLFRGQRVG